MYNSILEKIDNIEYAIKSSQSNDVRIYENEYYEFMDTERFVELYPECEEDLFDDTTFVVFEDGEDILICRQYNMDAIKSYCTYLSDFKQDILSDNEICEIKSDLLYFKNKYIL